MLDASVVVKWYCHEQDTDRALELREMYRRHRINIIVPDLLFYEVMNAIRYNPDIESGTKKRIAENLLSIGFDTIVPSEEQYLSALDLAFKKGLTIYDSIYSIIAEDMNGTYVTADEDFWNRTKSKDIILLSKWSV